VCSQPRSRTGRDALRRSFAKRHQTEGEDYREMLREAVRLHEGRSTSQQAGVGAGFPDWAMD
jgi:hypothetical protein